MGLKSVLGKLRERSPFSETISESASGNSAPTRGRASTLQPWALKNSGKGNSSEKDFYLTKVIAEDGGRATLSVQERPFLGVEGKKDLML